MCLAIQQAMAGQADDLGGGVFKKRLNDNMHRSIISPDELVAFRKLAAAYAQVTASEVSTGLRNGDLLEICHDG